MDILITDVTEMSRGTYCVAGWDGAAQRMVRPLPGGSNWNAGAIQQFSVVPGNTLRVMPYGASNGAFPHRTEDTPIIAGQIALIGQGFQGWLGANSPPHVADVANGFGGFVQSNSVWNNILQGAHVPANSQCSSLIGLQVPAANLIFVVDFGKPKAVIFDGTANYKLSVVSHFLKSVWRSGGISALTPVLPNRQNFYLRIGLARPLGGKCYLMLNSVL